MAASYQTRMAYPDSLFKFDLTYYDRNTLILRSTSCDTLDAIYTANITYKNSIQTVSVDVAAGKPLNASLLSINSLFYQIVQAPDPTASNVSSAVPSFQYMFPSDLSQLFHGARMRAMRDSLIRPRVELYRISVCLALVATGRCDSLTAL